MRHQTAGNHRSHRVESVLERGGDAEVAAATSDGPEEVEILVGRGTADGAVCHHHLRRYQVVERQPVLRHEPPETAAERQAGNAGRPDHAACGREAMQLRFAVELLPEDAALGAGRASCCIDVNSLHRREVDHQSAVDRSTAADVVAATADRNLEVRCAREIYCIGHVGRAVAPRDERGSLVNQAVVHAPGVVISRIGRLQQMARECR